MWLYVPSEASACVPESQVSTEDSTSPWAVDSTRLCFVRGKSFAPPYLPKGVVKEEFLTRLSGLTLNPLTLNRLADRWISSRLVSHALPLACTSSQKTATAAYQVFLLEMRSSRTVAAGVPLPPSCTNATSPSGPLEPKAPQISSQQTSTLSTLGDWADTGITTGGLTIEFGQNPDGSRPPESKPQTSLVRFCHPLSTSQAAQLFGGLSADTLQMDGGLLGLGARAKTARPWPTLAGGSSSAADTTSPTCLPRKLLKPDSVPVETHAGQAQNFTSLIGHFLDFLSRSENTRTASICQELPLDSTRSSARPCLTDIFLATVGSRQTVTDTSLLSASDSLLAYAFLPNAHTELLAASDVLPENASALLKAELLKNGLSIESSFLLGTAQLSLTATSDGNASVKTTLAAQEMSTTSPYTKMSLIVSTVPSSTIASHFQRPENEEVPKTRGICGPTSQDTSPPSGPLCSFAKMSLDCLPWGLNKSAKTYQQWAMQLRLAYSQRQKSAHRTYENDCSLLPTPTAAPYWTQRSETEIKQGTRRYSLTAMASTGMWPTPTTSDAEHGSPNQKYSAGGTALTASVNAIAPVKGQLNPAWVELLMGLPTGWTTLNGPTDGKTACHG